jgi:hypothetical protein
MSDKEKHELDYTLSANKNNEDMVTLYITQEPHPNSMDASFDLVLDKQGIKDLKYFCETGDNVDVVTEDGLTVSMSSHYVSNEFNITIGVQDGSNLTIFLPLHLKRAVCVHLHNAIKIKKQERGIKEQERGIQEQERGIKEQDDAGNLI